MYKAKRAMFKKTPKKQEQKQFEQSEGFSKFREAMRRILAVPKEELERREEKYQKKKTDRQTKN